MTVLLSRLGASARWATRGLEGPAPAWLALVSAALTPPGGFTSRQRAQIRAFASTAASAASGSAALIDPAALAAEGLRAAARLEKRGAAFDRLADAARQRAAAEAGEDAPAWAASSNILVAHVQAAAGLETFGLAAEGRNQLNRRVQKQRQAAEKAADDPGAADASPGRGAPGRGARREGKAADRGKRPGPDVVQGPDVAAWCRGGATLGVRLGNDERAREALARKAEEAARTVYFQDQLRRLETRRESSLAEQRVKKDERAKARQDHSAAARERAMARAAQVADKLRVREDAREARQKWREEAAAAKAQAKAAAAEQAAQKRAVLEERKSAILAARNTKEARKLASADRARKVVELLRARAVTQQESSGTQQESTQAEAGQQQQRKDE